MNFINILHIPTTSSGFSAILRYKNDEERKELIMGIATKISSLYSSFLTKEGYNSRDKNIQFNEINFHPSFPSRDIVIRFENNLKDTILNKLNECDEDCDLVSLVTEVVPEKLLSDILQKSGIKYGICYDLLPVYTSTEIRNRSKFSTIEIKMNQKYHGKSMNLDLNQYILGEKE